MIIAKVEKQHTSNQTSKG